MCKGDDHTPYPDSCPNGGHVDHVECMYGIFSRHPLHDPTVYDDDVVLHTSNQDCFPYYRPMHTLEDTPAMEGNCKAAGKGFGKNEMYPCVDANVTYGLAVTGLDVAGAAGRTAVQVDFQPGYEPNVREGEAPIDVHANVTVTGLTPGDTYTLLRYVGTSTLPKGPPFGLCNWSTSVVSDENGMAFVNAAPPFKSDLAVYHLTVAAADAPPQH